MNFLDKDKMKISVLVVAFLLLASTFAFLPIAGAYSTPATENVPVAVTGATAIIDYPIFASIAVTTPTADQRVITVNNPAGNPSITSITVSVPSGAVSAAPTGTIPSYGGVPDCTGTCNAKVFGTGPYSVEYCDTVGTCGTSAILPAGASIELTITITPETTTAGSSAADSYQFAVAVTDTGGANTVLSPITTYYTKATSIVAGTPTATTPTAGTLVTYTATVNQSGLPLYAGPTSVGAAGSPTVSPTSYTSTTSAQTVTLNDTTAEADVFQVGGPSTTSHDTNGLLSNASSGTITWGAGAPAQLSIKVNSEKSSHQVNMTGTSSTVNLIPNTGIVVYSTDKYGNPVNPSSALSVTLSATSLKGQAPGFTADTVYTGNYPYTPTDLSPTTTVSIPISASSGSPAAGVYYYFAPDYGATSQITATATGLPTATSSKIVTWGLDTSAAVTLAVQGGNSVKAGSAALFGAKLPVAQAGMTVYFTITTNSSDYAGLFTNGLSTISTTSFGNTTGGFATASLNVDTTQGATATVQASYLAKPTANDTGTNPTVTVTTATGNLGSLTVKAYFDSAQSNKAKAVAASGTLYLDVSAADAYGNSITVASGTVQISLSTTAGSLSTNTAYITATHSDITGSNYQVQFVAPTSGSFTITASGTYSGVSASGSLTLTVVSKSPTIVFTTVPTSVTTGVAQQIIGWANVSTGVSPTTITSLKYSLNGATNVTLAAGAATNQFTISAVLATNNNIIVYATDGNSVTSTGSVQVPAVAVSQTFQNSSAIQKITFTNGPSAINATYTNHGSTSLTVIVIANVLNSQGAIILESTGTVTVASGATGSAYPIIQGIASGTYTVQVTVYSLAYVTLSPTTSITVTV